MGPSLACISIMRLNRERNFVRRPCTTNISKRIILFSQIVSPNKKKEVRQERPQSSGLKGCTKSGSSVKKRLRRSEERSSKRRIKWRRCSCITAIRKSNSQESHSLALSAHNFQELFQMFNHRTMVAKDLLTQTVSMNYTSSLNVRKRSRKLSERRFSKSRATLSSLILTLRCRLQEFHKKLKRVGTVM